MLRTKVRLSKHNVVRSDIAPAAVTTGKLPVTAEVVNSGDPAPDTQIKKQSYEDLQRPRLWMIGPRYDNTEVRIGRWDSVMAGRITRLPDK